MSITVIDPIGKAFERTKLVLFRPFEVGKWFKLGFCAWLASFVEGGSGSGGMGNSGSGWQESSGEEFGEGLEKAQDWVAENQELLIGIGSAVLFFLIAVFVLTAWLGSRGRFMFLDGVVKNRGAVVKPWNEFTALGNSLFRFQLLLLFFGFLFFVVSVAAGVAVAWGDIEARQFDAAAIGGIVLGGGLLVVLTFVVGLVNLFTRDFVVPAMYSRNLFVSDAWDAVRTEVLGEHTGSVVLYCLMKLVLGMALGMLVFAVILLSCCVLAIPLMIPYIGTVMLLPMFVFMRCYSLYFLDQLGGSWRLIHAEDAEPEEPDEPEWA